MSRSFNKRFCLFYAQFLDRVDRGGNVEGLYGGSRPPLVYAAKVRGGHFQNNAPKRFRQGLNRLNRRRLERDLNRRLREDPLEDVWVGAKDVNNDANWHFY